MCVGGGVGRAPLPDPSPPRGCAWIRGCAWQEVQRADARPRLVARCAVTAERAAAHSTQCAPEMRLEPRIAPGGGRGGRWRRSARGRSRLGCGVEDAAMGRHSAAAGGSPCGLSRACRGAFDAARAGDAARAADRRSPQEAAVVVGGAHSRARVLYLVRPQTIIAKHSSRSPTHAHSHPRPQCGRCRERLPPRAQLHTGTELSASQARSSVEPSGRPTVRAPARLRPWAVAHGARCSAKLS